jgi:uncharacterized membrane protein YagU involved in acid resistance
MGGAIAGIFDLLLAFADTKLHTGYGPAVVLKAIASGLLGTHAFFRGTGTAFLGLVLHFFIAFAWATYFAVAAIRWLVLIRRPVLSGAICGVVIYLVMYWVVLPLSSFPRPLWRSGMSFGHIALELIGHITLIGIPIAMSVRYCAMRAIGAQRRPI